MTRTPVALVALSLLALAATPPAVSRAEEGPARLREWRPWPGETVTLRVTVSPYRSISVSDLLVMYHDAAAAQGLLRAVVIDDDFDAIHFIPDLDAEGICAAGSCAIARPDHEPERGVVGG